MREKRFDLSLPRAIHQRQVSGYDAKTSRLRIPQLHTERSAAFNSRMGDIENRSRCNRKTRKNRISELTFFVHACGGEYQMQAKRIAHRVERVGANGWQKNFLQRNDVDIQLANDEAGPR